MGKMRYDTLVMSRLLKRDAIVKKEVNMRRVTAWLFALVFIICLTACKEKSGDTNVTTPGNLITPAPYTPRVSAENTDVSAEYADQLSSYPWLETYDWTYYVFHKDGTYQHMKDKDLTEEIDSGSWQMRKDAHGYMLLHMEVKGGEAFDLYDLELYEESLFAHSLTETSYIWLLCTPTEE